MTASYDLRKELSLRSAQVAREVARLGQLQGLWVTIDDTALEGDPTRYFARLITAEGLAFSIQGGTWGHENKVRAGVADARLGAHRVAARGAPEARVASGRGPEVCLKELTRRVYAHPEGIASAQQALQEVREQAQGACELSTRVEALRALGVSFGDVRPTDHASARGYHTKLGRVHVTRDGELTMDYVRLPQDKLSALLALLND